MNIAMIGCPFQTSFGAYLCSLKSAVEKRGVCSVRWVASNCGCGDVMEQKRRFATFECDYFSMVLPSDYQSDVRWKRQLRNTARSAILKVRVRRYNSLCHGAELLHFHQVLNAYGSKAVFYWLNRPSAARRVVTVHELDVDQLNAPETNRTYNRADAVIVHCTEMRDRLIEFGVDPARLHVVLHGTVIPEEDPRFQPRDIVFYGGHKLMSNKGFEDVLKAYRIARRHLQGDCPRLIVHGHYGFATPVEALALARSLDLEDAIVWLNQVNVDEMLNVYRRAMICVLPYTGSFAGLPAATAAACGVAVIATRRAGIPDHLGSAAVWVEERNPEQLAAAITSLIEDGAVRDRLRVEGRKRAETCLDWDLIADETLRIYRDVVGETGGGRRGGEPTFLPSSEKPARSGMPHSTARGMPFPATNSIGS